MIICLGPVCVPLHLLLAFLVGLAHQHGYMTWFKREWVMFSWWRQQCNRLLGRAPPGEGKAAAAGTQPACCDGAAAAPAAEGSEPADGGGTAAAAAPSGSARARTRAAAAGAASAK